MSAQQQSQQADTPLKIVRLESENVKRLAAVAIAPEGNLVQITGRNGQGKTSVMDSIWWAIAGAKHIQSAPIRKDAKEARIRLDLGDKGKVEMIVTRRFRKREDGGVATDLVVENASGARYQRPQQMLDDLLGSLTFDPLAFSRMDPPAQFDALKRFVPDVDFAAIEGRNKKDFEARTDINRKAKEARASAAVFVVSAATPKEHVDEQALVAKLDAAGKTNADLEQRKARRDAAAAEVTRGRRDAVIKRDEADRLRKLAEAADAEAVRLEAAADATQKKLDAADALPTPIDTADLLKAIAAARQTNKEIENRHARDQLLRDAEALEKESQRLTDAMAARDADKAAKIAAAKLPVEGLGFGDSVVLLNGLPFDQASDAEQLRVSCAVAMAGNPKLRVIRVRDGSLLDKHGMQLLAEMADKHDMQVWIECVDDSGLVGVVIEDGRVKGQQQAGPAPVAADVSAAAGAGA